MQIGITIEKKGKGVFPGSRVASLSEDVWEHGLLEAHRHYRIFRDKNIAYFGNNIIYRRIEYFANHGESALAQIEKANKVNWDSPKIRLLKHYQIESGNYFLWRALCHDFIPWSSGDEERFVY